MVPKDYYEDLKETLEDVKLLNRRNKIDDELIHNKEIVYND